MKKHKSAKGWVILLFLPLFISSCVPATSVFWTIAIYVGDALVYTAAGYAIQQVVDQLVDYIFHKDVGYVIPDSNNPLYGTYSTTMKFINKDTGKKYQISHPRMYRYSLQSNWELAPDLKELVGQVLNN